jgi:hypothetical protein
VSYRRVQPDHRMHEYPEAVCAPNNVPERRLVRVLAPHKPLRNVLRGPAKRQEQLRHVRQTLCDGAVPRGTVQVARR